MNHSPQRCRGGAELGRCAAYGTEITDGAFALVREFKPDRDFNDSFPKVPKFGSPCGEMQGHVNGIAGRTSEELTPCARGKYLPDSKGVASHCKIQAAEDGGR